MPYKFILTSKKPHKFIRDCNGSRTHIEVPPGTSMLTIEPGCSLNTSDINLLNPSGIVLTNQKLTLEREPIFRFSQEIRIKNKNLIQPESHIKTRLTKLELEHTGDTEFNEHIESNSKIYITLALLIITLLGIAISIVYFKITLITPIIDLMRRHWANKHAPKISNI